MFDDLRNQSDQKNKPPLGPQPPIAPKEDISQRIKGLEEQGSKQGKRKTIYSVIGIAVILLFAGGIITAGYYFWPEITVGFNELIGKSEVTNDIVVNNNSENETAENQDNYYQELIQGCEEFKEGDITTDYDCCVQTVEIMRKNNYRLAPQNGCPEGFQGNSLWCMGAYAWCEPVDNEVNENISASSTEENIDLDISKWRVYWNEVLGVELKYPENWEVLGGDFTHINLSIRNKKYEKAWEWPGLSLRDEYGAKEFINKKISDKFLLEYAENAVIKIIYEIDGSKIYANCSLYAENEQENQEVLKICNQILSNFKFISREEIADTDKDGLNNDEEAQYGTDANNSDSDGDGYLDGDEVRNGYNPMGEGKLQ